MFGDGPMISDWGIGERFFHCIHGGLPPDPNLETTQACQMGDFTAVSTRPILVRPFIFSEMLHKTNAFRRDLVAERRTQTPKFIENCSPAPNKIFPLYFHGAGAKRLFKETPGDGSGGQPRARVRWRSSAGAGRKLLNCLSKTRKANRMGRFSALEQSRYDEADCPSCFEPRGMYCLKGGKTSKKNCYSENEENAKVAAASSEEEG